MNRSDDDREIRKHFKLAHEYHESLASSFQEILGRARPQQAQRSARRFRLVVAGFVSAALICTMTYLVWYEKPHPQPVAIEFSSLSNWHSPTDFLLKTPGLELLETTPTIPSPLPDLPNLQKIQMPSGNVR